MCGVVGCVGCVFGVVLSHIGGGGGERRGGGGGEVGGGRRGRVGEKDGARGRGDGRSN